MTDFNQLHKLANELEEFSSKTLNKNTEIRPKPITSGTILFSTTESDISFFDRKEASLPPKLHKKEKKVWPSSPSLEFFSSSEVLQAEKRELKQSILGNKEKSKKLALKISESNLNAQTLLSSMDNFAPLKGEKKVNNNIDWKDNRELSDTLENIGFITIEDNLIEHKNSKEETSLFKTNLNEKLNTNRLVKSQAFTCLNKELGFSFSAFTLDLVLNFSIFVLINSVYKVFFIESLFQLPALKFFFIFSFIFQLSSFLQRVVFKKTFGEWYTNVQLGTEKQQSEILFSLSLFWKSFITLFTGVIVLPVISFLINKDLSYYLTDLQTFEKISK